MKIFFIILCLLCIVSCSKSDQTLSENDDYKIKYLDTLEMILMNILYEEDTNGVMRGTTFPKYGLTMIGHRRMAHLRETIIEVLNNQIEGDILEAGCWKGGAMMYARAILNAYNGKDRKVYCCDSFEGIPRMDDAIYAMDRNAHNFDVLNNNPVEKVIYNFKKLGLNEGTIMVKGYFHNTFPKLKLNKLSILRLDGDTYNSTYISLLYLYPKLSIGGYIIIDDYIDWLSCRDATDTYRSEHNITEKIELIHYENGEILRGVYWKKEKDI